jgi:translation initiation factor IF-1
MNPEDDCVVLGHMLKNLRMHYVRIISVDKVAVELTPCDFSRATIVFRASQTRSKV